MVAKTKHCDHSNCPVACALDFIGDHWTLLVVRDLMFGAGHEFKDLLQAEEGISTNILTDRLKKLAQAEVIDSRPHPQSQRRKLYFLTDKGKALAPVIMEIANWSIQWSGKDFNIPQERLDMMELSRDQQLELILQNLAQWEIEMGIRDAG